ncbi:MAG: hypothetical protein BMS9Abin05_0409 [Rhodothermia bacterium]|nr:MAG: hypothetical protein BMS9Abin05_0409 [Rhodothermia bacterium]
MELVPILSTIILVGTVATFILAVAAYILYKIRERRVLENGSSYMSVDTSPHVLVSPTPYPVESASPRVQTPSTTTAEAGQAPSRRGSLFWEYTDEGFVPVRPQGPGMSSESEESEHAPNGGSAWL